MPNKDITDFLLTEYENVARAFFNSYDIGAKWVRYYLIILAVPFSFMAFIYHNNPQQFSLFNLTDSIAVLIFVIGVLNVLVAYIVIDLRLDSILYARTVNGIRKYFVEKVMKPDELGRVAHITDYILLPTDIEKPSFLKFNSGDLFFLTVFMVITNSIYISLGVTQIVEIKQWYIATIKPRNVGFIIFIVVAIIQYILFEKASEKKEKVYCRKGENGLVRSIEPDKKIKVSDGCGK